MIKSAGARASAPEFNYNTGFSICQAKSCTNYLLSVIPNLCNLTIVFSVCYDIMVLERGKRTSKRVQRIDCLVKGGQSDARVQRNFPKKLKKTIDKQT